MFRAEVDGTGAGVGEGNGTVSGAGYRRSRRAWERATGKGVGRGENIDVGR